MVRRAPPKARREELPSAGRDRASAARSEFYQGMPEIVIRVIAIPPDIEPAGLYGCLLLQRLAVAGGRDIDLPVLEREIEVCLLQHIHADHDIGQDFRQIESVARGSGDMR